MNMTKVYDAIIIGSGQAGNPLSFALAEKGQKVAMIEKNTFGGSCINYGCTPTKALIASANLNHRVQRSEELGVMTKSVELDFKAVMNRKNKIVKSFRSSIEKSLEGTENIAIYRGTANFVNNNTINIVLNDGEEEQIQGKKIYINSGGKANIVSIEGLDDVEYYDSTSIMELAELPEHLVIIGTGYIALEFGQMFRRFGSKVTMIGRQESILKKEDQEISSRIQKILEEDGITFLLNTETKKVEKDLDGVNIYIEKNAKKEKIKCSHLMLATGRVPAIEDLKLENAGVKLADKGNIQVDEKLKTNVDNIYALGDVKGGPQFTHISYDDYRIVIDNLFGNGTRNINDRLVPFTLFIDPQLGRVGLTESQAIEKGYDIKVGKLEMKNLGRAIEENVTKGFMKAIINKEDNKILGAAILGDQGGEIMAIIQVAMMADINYQKLRDGIFTHPSFSEALNNLFSV